jgi:hypothetical protein
MCRRIRILAFVLALSTLPATAQAPDQLRARQLMDAGQPEAALNLLENLRMTHTVLEDRARAHLLLARRSSGRERCSHARSAYEFASMASNSQLVSLADKIFRDELCPLDPDTAK